MKTENVTVDVISDWKIAMENLGFTYVKQINVSNTIYEVFSYSDFSKVGIAFKQRALNVANIECVTIWDLENDTPIESSIGPIDYASGSTRNRISYENLINGGIIVSFANSASSPYGFIAFVPSNEIGINGYVICNYGNTISRIYIDVDTSWDSANKLVFTNTIIPEVDSQNIQMVETYDYLNNALINGMFLTITNPFSYLCSSQGCYKIIQLNNKNYFIISGGNAVSNIKFAFEMADTLSNNS